MNTRHLTALAAVAFLACREEPRTNSWHRRPQSLVLSLALGDSVATDTIRREMASTISFGALVSSDTSHIHPVVARELGPLANIRAAGRVRIGDSLGIIRNDVSAQSLVADRGGHWLPRRFSGQVVFRGDTIGTLRISDLRKAVGAVGELEHGAIHPGDPATVRIGPGPADTARGTVEIIYRPGQRMPYSAEVTTEFVWPSELRTPVTVSVHPSHGVDSVLTINPAALASLEWGSVVFVLQRDGTQQAVWVTTGPMVGNRVTVLGDLPPGTAVLTSSLPRLAAAVSDSMRLGNRR